MTVCLFSVVDSRHICSLLLSSEFHYALNCSKNDLRPIRLSPSGLGQWLPFHRYHWRLVFDVFAVKFAFNKMPNVHPRFNCLLTYLRTYLDTLTFTLILASREKVFPAYIVTLRTRHVTYSSWPRHTTVCHRQCPGCCDLRPRAPARIPCTSRRIHVRAYGWSEIGHWWHSQEGRWTLPSGFSHIDTHPNE